MCTGYVLAAVFNVCVIITQLSSIYMRVTVSLLKLCYMLQYCVLLIQENDQTRAVDK